MVIPSDYPHGILFMSLFQPWMPPMGQDWGTDEDLTLQGSLLNIVQCAMVA